MLKMLKVLKSIKLQAFGKFFCFLFGFLMNDGRTFFDSY